MVALLKLVSDVRQMSDLPVALGAKPWDAATEAKRRAAEMRQAVIAPLAALVEGGASMNNAVRLVLAQAAAGLLDPAVAHAMQSAATKEGEDAPSFATLKRWLGDYLRCGKDGLAYGWDQRAVALYNSPSKPGFADVAWRLRSEGFADATESRVKRYLKALPATLGEKSPARIGKHLHRLTRQKYQRRNLDEVLVGEIYAGDGHTVDCYVAHPNTGKPFRPELTCFIDIKSRYVPGWYFTESESAVSTLFALSAAMLGHDHVPAWLYIDRGAGYRAKLLSDESTGWYQKFDIDVIGALPGNPHGKGWIERFFRTCRDKHDKFFFGGQVYCGHDMAEEVNRRLSAELAAGRRKLPSFQDYVSSFAKFMDSYFNEPMDVLDGRTPAQLWAELVPVAVGVEAEAVMRPSQEATVGRQTVRLHNRFYYHEALALYDGKKVMVEYDLHKDGLVWVQDKKGRLICEAKLVSVIGVLPTSRIEEGRDRRLKGQVKRLERKLDEAHARRADPINADAQARAIEDLEIGAELGLPAPALALQAPADKPNKPAKAARPEADDDIVIDLTSYNGDKP
jgi:putative transposase